MIKNDPIVYFDLDTDQDIFEQGDGPIPSVGSIIQTLDGETNWLVRTIDYSTRTKRVEVGMEKISWQIQP